MSWAVNYLGIPHAPLGRVGNLLDCWGLLARVYRDELGIALPLYHGVHPCQTERAEVAALLQAGASHAPWRAVDHIRAFDALLFRQGRHATHVAVALDARRMLHSAAGGAVIVDRCAAPWGTRFIAAYRHEAVT